MPRFFRGLHLKDRLMTNGSVSVFNLAHLIQPPSSKTLKTFGACLTSAWLIQDPQWIFDSVAKGLWLPEEKYGYRIDVNPFKNTKIYMTPAFKECPTTKGFRVGFMKCLVIGCSDGSFVDTPKEADYVLVGDNEDKRYLQLMQFI